MRPKLSSRDRLPFGFRRSADISRRLPARTRRFQAKLLVSEEELARTVHEYRHVREAHRRARPVGSARRKLEARLLRTRRRFERLIDEAPLGNRERRRWRNALRGSGSMPAVHAAVRPVLYRGRSAAGSELLLLPMPDGTLEAVVDGASTEVLDCADELERTEPGLVFELEGTAFDETFVAPQSTLEELREAIAGGRAPLRENLRELIEDGLLDGTLGLTTRGRRALALDRSPARPETPSPTPTITVRGSVSPSARAELAETLARLARASPRPVLLIRGVIARDEDPAVRRPVTAKATFELGRHTLHAHAVAASEHEAIDLLADRVRRRLRTLGERAVAERREGALRGHRR
jgi:ribosome-associated translation inhibitor RaiA